MIALAMGILGFVSPFLPNIIKLFERGQENRHEIAMLGARLQYETKMADLKMAQIEATADIEEAKVIYTAAGGANSYGVKMIDAMDGKGWGMIWTLPLIYLFSFLDFLIGGVRPVIAYTAFGFYCLTKWSLYLSLEKNYFGPDGASNAQDTGLLVGQIWTDQDFAILTLVLAHYFGQRAAKYAFGWTSGGRR